MKWTVGDLQGEKVIPLAGCFLEKVKETCQYLGRSCESLMEKYYQDWEGEKKNKNKNKHAENSFQEPTKYSSEGRRRRDIFFSNAHTWVQCRVMQRTQTLESERRVFQPCTLIGVALGESLNFMSQFPSQ